MNDTLKKKFQAILLEITVVDKDNLMSTVIKDGYAKFEDVYKNVPAEQRPKVDKFELTELTRVKLKFWKLCNSETLNSRLLCFFLEIRSIVKRISRRKGF